MCTTKHAKKKFLCNFFGASNFLTVLHRRELSKEAYYFIKLAAGGSPFLPLAHIQVKQMLSLYASPIKFMCKLIVMSDGPKPSS